MVPSPPVGYAVGNNRSGGCTIGKRIGSGAQGYVHEILDEHGAPTKFVAKLHELPKNWAGKGRKPSTAQTNCGLLNKEKDFYLSAGCDLRKEGVIPNVPTGSAKEDGGVKLVQWGDLADENGVPGTFLIKQYISIR